MRALAARFRTVFQVFAAAMLLGAAVSLLAPRAAKGSNYAVAYFNGVVECTDDPGTACSHQAS